MEIERINENTVKFFISYMDIEERGFDRDEIWYNRERSEELFWEMMDEVHHEEDFSVEGPLWIQVQALDKGLEVLVTKAQLSKDGLKYELPVIDDKYRDLPVDDKIESLLDEQFMKDEDFEGDDENGELLEFLVRFQDFEDLISLAHRFNFENIVDRLYSYENRYYLYIEFINAEEQTEDELDTIISKLLEYSYESTMTIHRLEEYGAKIIDENALQTIRENFPLK
ncbi:adaptor protein MecA [Bacillus sp. HMF5848]|uniref:adaptor protein MecA n=1 Tax=Bacillus sp. HMF5848 TaxID=2495421 RepID=UPI000F777ADE|nr:adaptor protein MecA [Bacillus sp. HMF5848]RSK26485.1 adaptor protein MecA [Bacillus sp. HMF5848]